MAERGSVTDYAGEELFPGDLIAYAARHGTRVRMTDARIEKVLIVREGTHVVPVLKVKPTGSESGFKARKTLRTEWIYAEHVRLIRSGTGIRL